MLIFFCRIIKLLTMLVSVLFIVLISSKCVLQSEGKALEKISLNGKWFVESETGRTVLFRGNEIDGCTQLINHIGLQFKAFNLKE